MSHSVAYVRKGPPGAAACQPDFRDLLRAASMAAFMKRQRKFSFLPSGSFQSDLGSCYLGPWNGARSLPPKRDGSA